MIVRKGTPFIPSSPAASQWPHIAQMAQCRHFAVLLFFDCCVFCRFSPTLNVITADIFMVLRYRVKRSVVLVFCYWQRLVAQFVFHLYFCQSVTHPAARFVCDSWLLVGFGCSLQYNSSIAAKPDNPVDWGQLNWGLLIIGYEVTAIWLVETRNLKR